MFKNQEQQIFSAVAASLAPLISGTKTGYTSSALPSLKSGNVTAGDFVISEEQGALYSSLFPLTQLFTYSLLLSPFLKYFGRKRTLLYICAPGFILGWALTAASSNIYLLDVGRVVLSFAGAISFGGSMLYITEISDKNIRGILVTLPTIFMSAGVLASYAFGAFLDWQWLAIASMLFAVPFAVVFFFAPESPYWLAETGKKDGAEKVIMQLSKCSKEEAGDKLKSMEKRIFFKSIEDEADGYNSGFRALTEPPILKTFLVCIALMLLQEFTGVKVVIFNCVEIFQDAGSSINPYFSSVIIGFVQLIFNILTSAFIDKFGRKFLLLLSSIGMTISLTVLGTYFYLKETSSVEGLGWLPLITLMIYMAAYSIGYGPIPPILASELLPQRVRIKLNPVVMSSSSLAFFAVTYSYNDMRKTLHMYGCFWFYAAAALLTIFIDVFCIPETKGKTFEEIQEFYGGRKYKGSISGIKTPLLQSLVIAQEELEDETFC